MPEATETTEATEATEPAEATAPAEVAEARRPAAAAPVADATVESSERHNRKTREGLVVSDKMEKTAVVAVIERVRHAKYGKFMMRTKRLYAHDETNDAKIGDKVRVMETRPLSKNKRWRVVEVLERAK
jgi:small subunit ribosomal protein S17